MMILLCMAVGILDLHLQVFHLSILLDGQNKASKVDTPSKTANQVINSNLVYLCSLSSLKWPVVNHVVACMLETRAAPHLKIGLKI